MYYSGIDLHSDNCYITTLNDDGSVVKQQRVENIDEQILVYYVLTNKSQYKGFKSQPISRQKSAQWPSLSSPDA